MLLFVSLLQLLFYTATTQVSTPVTTPIPYQEWPAFSPGADVLGHVYTVDALSPENTSVFNPNLIPPNRKQPILDPSIDIVMGAVAPETTPVFSPRPIPPNRKKPVINLDKGLVMGALLPPVAMPVSVHHAMNPVMGALLPPVAMPVSVHHTMNPVMSSGSSTRVTTPVISKADVVMAVMDSMGTVVDNLAENLMVDLNGILNKLPVPPQMTQTPAPSAKGTRSMEKQQAVQEQVELETSMESLDSDSVLSFLVDLYGQLDSSDPKTVTDRFQERYDALLSYFKLNDGITLEEALKITLRSQTEGLKLSSHQISRMQYLLHLLADN